MNSALGKIKRDGLPETPRASSSGSERVPTNCAIVQGGPRRSKRLAQQAIVAKNVTAPAQRDLHLEETINRKRSLSPRFNKLICNEYITDRRTYAPVLQLEQHHSEYDSDVIFHSLSLDKESVSEQHGKLFHATRDSNISCLEREQKPKLDYPPPHDRKWEEVAGNLDEELLSLGTASMAAPNPP